MYNGLEKRKFHRVKKPFMVRLRNRSNGSSGKASTEWDMIAVEDLGATGTFFQYDKYITIGSVLDLKMDVSVSTPTINCTGIVIRKEKNKNNPTFGIRVAFVDIGEQEKEMINKAVKENLRQKKQSALAYK